MTLQLCIHDLHVSFPLLRTYCNVYNFFCHKNKRNHRVNGHSSKIEITGLIEFLVGSYALSLEKNVLVQNKTVLYFYL